MTRPLALALLLLLTAPAWADDRPFVHSPSGPGVGRGALGVGVVTLLSADATHPLPFAQLHYVRGLSELVDLTAEVDTMGLLTFAKVGVRLAVGDGYSLAAVGLEAGAGLAVTGFFGPLELVPAGLLSPSFALGLAGDALAFTVRGEAALVLSEAGLDVLSRLTGVLELKVASAGALSVGGGAIVNVGAASAGPLAMVGWVW